MLKLIPSSFHLQWHITERCNWNCRHCYKDKDREELSVEELYRIFLQFIRLLDILKIRNNLAALNITGGEPMLREDFFLFLERITRLKKRFRIGIMTNGSLITSESAKRLKSSGVDSVQVSLEGLEKNNDAIRGKGSFQRIIRALKILVKNNLEVKVSLTLTRKNLKDLPQLVKLCEKLKVAAIGARRFVPIGRGIGLKKYMLSPLQQRKVYLWREQQRVIHSFQGNKLGLWHGCEDGIGLYKTLFPHRISSLHACGVIEGRGLTILPSGDVFACRRLPIKIGNVLKEDLAHIYLFSEKFWQLRNLYNANDLCKKCVAFRYCLGGAKCITYGYFNKLSAPDPQCWRIFNKLPTEKLFHNIKNKNIRKITLSAERIQDGLFTKRCH